MTRLPATSRWLITVALAAWLPLCFCQAADVVRLTLSFAGIAAPAAASECGSCCGTKREPAPVNAAADSSCCGVTLKIAPRPDRWTPTADLCGSALAAAPCTDLSVPAAQSPPPFRDEQAAPSIAAARTLLRQHCALTI